jgi:hydrogenase/urease accessory protein HupE
MVKGITFRHYVLGFAMAGIILALTGCAGTMAVTETREEICKRKAMAIRAAQATIAAFEAVCPFENIDDETK